MAFSTHKTGIIGAGGWGTAISYPLAENGHEVIIWSYEDDVADELNTKRTNAAYLPGITIHKNIKAVTDPAMLADCDILVNAVPTQYIRPTFAKFEDIVRDKIIVNLSKGIERGSLLRVFEIFHDMFGLDENNYVVLTGPSHAEEVARKMPTTITAASKNIDAARKVQAVFSTPDFRVYASNDLIGCETGGALKNVIAIAAGIIDGMGLGDNTKAALITRGLAEMSRLGIKLGADPITFSGLSGLGDLIVTCNSMHSRNRYVGEQIGKGRSLDDIKAETKKIAEGVFTTESAYELARKHDVDMPIVNQMYRIIFEGLAPAIAIEELMARSSKAEWWR